MGRIHVEHEHRRGVKGNNIDMLCSLFCNKTTLFWKGSINNKKNTSSWINLTSGPRYSSNIYIVKRSSSFKVHEKYSVWRGCLFGLLGLWFGPHGLQLKVQWVVVEIWPAEFEVRDLLMHRFCWLLSLFKGQSSPGVCLDVFLPSVQVSEILAIDLLLLVRVWTSPFFISRGIK